MKRIISFILAFILLPLISADAKERQWNIKAVNGTYTYENRIDLSSTVVAVIDSGFNTGHEDLKDVNIVSPHNFTGGDENDVNDDRGHGTFITGVLAAGYDNGKGADGLCSTAGIMPLKVYSKSVSPKVSAVIEAVDYAVEHGADVINISMGVSKDNDKLRTSLKRAFDAGVIIIAAVGNDGKTEIAYPAAYDFVVGVGSVDINLEYSEYSRYNESVFVCAPGEGVYTCSVPESDSYTYAYGTSFAAPHIAALAAVAKAYDKTIDGYGFMQLLKDSSRDLGETGYDIYYGYGLVDFKAFIDLMTEYDIDLDGRVDTTDILMLKRILLNMSGTPSGRVFFAADADGDGVITVTDYVYFKRKLMHLI